uniref:Secreted RxLR effector peptide protein n=1 Tax=Panagrellus redivivus TaxID=6233 RepID=A0A7E5A1S3_PANRE
MVFFKAAVIILGVSLGIASGATVRRSYLDTPAAAATSRNSTIDPFAEYKVIMPADAFTKLLAIYAKKELTSMEKFAELNELFKTLPEDVIEKMPLPKVFRKLPASIQRQIHAVYYSKELKLEDKLDKLDDIINNMPPELMKLIPHQPKFPEVPEAIEFQVSVLLHFNGYFHIDDLRDYLDPEMYDHLLILARQTDLPETTRAFLIGRLLKEAYEANSESFPLPIGEGGPNDTMPEPVRRAGLHLMFSRNPFDQSEPFEKLIAEFQALSSLATRKTGTNGPSVNSVNYHPSKQGAGRKSFRKLQFGNSPSLQWENLEQFVDKLKLKVDY